MTIINRSVTDIIDTEYRSFAMYTLENRAIPSAIDGMKPVHRKLLYAMLTDYKNKKVKLNDLGSISRFNYHHGETSATAAAVNLTADWNNNCPLFIGHGNFGSRMIQEAAAPRYIFATLSPTVDKIFTDSEVAPKSTDEENPEPAHYLPIIPWVLVNGISGIAVGFATDILPHSVADITTATRACVKNPERFLAEKQVIKPTFPHFKGTVGQEHVDGLHWSTTGIVEYIGKYTYKISELPIGYERESYINTLTKLVDAEKIKDFDDCCSEDGFGFTVKVSAAQKTVIEFDPIAYFKLKKLHSANLTTLGHDGKLKIFTSVHELIHYFCQYRLTKVEEKLAYDIDKLSSEITQLEDKIKFIKLVISGKIDLRSTTKAELLTIIMTKITEADYGKTFVNIPLYACTVDEIKKYEELLDEKCSDRGYLKEQTPKKLFLKCLSDLKV